MGRAAELLLALASSLATVAVVVLPSGVEATGECGNVSCGMGSCVESGDYAFGFACRCKPGWSRYHIGELQFPFLPCVIPNCTIDYKCQGGSSSSPAPAPSPPTTTFSIFDPCLMQYCGDGGACERASEFTHRCTCHDGYANLLNDTSYPCYRQCSLGSDCKGLGIVVMDGSTPISSLPAPFSIAVKNSGGGGAAAAPADRLLQLLLPLVSLLWLQAI